VVRRGGGGEGRGVRAGGRGPLKFFDRAAIFKRAFKVL